MRYLWNATTLVWSIPGKKLMHYRRSLAASVIVFAILAPAIGAEALAEAPVENAPPRTTRVTACGTRCERSCYSSVLERTLRYSRSRVREGQEDRPNSPA